MVRAPVMDQHYRVLTAVACSCALLAGCGANADSPSSSPSPVAAPAPIVRGLLSGVIRDGLDGTPVAGVGVMIFNDEVTTTDANGRYSAGITVGGSPFLSFRKDGFSNLGNTISIGEGPMMIDWALPRLCAILATASPTADVQRGFVDFDWKILSSRHPTATGWVLEIGTIGSTNSTVVPAGRYASANVLSQETGASTSYHWAPAFIEPQRYWARVRARNNCGIGEPSQNTILTVAP